MANRFLKFIYVISAETPIIVVFAFVWLIEKSKWSDTVCISWKVPLILFGISVAFWIAFNILFKYANKNLQNYHVNVTDVSNGDGWLIAYIISYLLPLASFKFGDHIQLVIMLIISILHIALTFTDYITPHPFLYLKGFKFYKINVDGAASGFYLISKKKLHKSADIFKVAQIFDFLLVNVG